MTEYEYDVAFSFLAQDLRIAHELADRLTPGLRTFVYDRHAEDLLAGDGMERFAVVFREKSRLHVVLHRTEWGGSPWTGIEEIHIKDRALMSRFTSLAFVALEQNPVPPVWVPRFYLYLSEFQNTRAETAAVIRARALELGASLKRETIVERAQREAARQENVKDRAVILSSYLGVEAAKSEVKLLFAAMEEHVQALSSAMPGFGLSVVRHPAQAPTLLIRAGIVQLTLCWNLAYNNSTTDAHLDVGWRKSRHEINWSYYDFALTEDGTSAWRYEGAGNRGGLLTLVSAAMSELMTTSILAEKLMIELTDRIQHRSS